MKFNPTHRHKKLGSEYEVIGEATLKIDTTFLTNGEQVAVYRDVAGKLWVRSVAEFNDGRFETINKENENG